MRTTLTIADDVSEAVERLRRRENLSLREAIDRLLRAGIERVSAPPPADRYVGPVFESRLEEGIDPNRLNQLVDQLEADEFHP